MANFTQGVEEEVRFTVNGKEVVVGKEVGPQTRLARYQWLTWRDISAYGVPDHLTTATDHCKPLSGTQIQVLARDSSPDWN